MCSYCLKDECPPGCPNYEPKYSIYECDFCLEKIQVGEEMYMRYDGATCHCDCAFNEYLDDFAKWAGVEIKEARDEFDF